MSSFLSSILTTVIGYYFGQREGEKKTEEAANKKVEEVGEQAQDLVQQVTRERDDAILKSKGKNNSGDADEEIKELPSIDSDFDNQFNK